MSYQSVPAEKVQVGDILSVNTGYRPLDDEYCQVLIVKPPYIGLFGDVYICFYIQSIHGDHDFCIPLDSHVTKIVPCPV